MVAQRLTVTVIPPVPGERWISIERYVESLRHATANRDSGLDVRVLPTASGGALGPISGYRARYRELPRRLRRQAFDGIVHIADQALGHLVELVPGRPAIVTCHDLMPVAAEGHYTSRFRGWIDRTLLDRSLAGMLTATRIIAVSRTTAREVVRLFGFPEDRISHVPNIVGPTFHPAPRPAAWLRARGVLLPPRPRILSVGHSRPYKNLELLIEALARPALRGASLVRCGAPLTPAQRSLAARLGVDGRITELGYREPDELCRIYSACDVLAQPSRAEGFGVPVIEAMACGLPVVCSDASALCEVSDGAAFVVPVLGADVCDAASAFADALAAVLSDADRARSLRAAGFERARAFRPRAVLPRLAAAYRAAAEDYGT